MSYRVYGVLVFVAGCWAWWFASPPVGKPVGLLFLLYVGGFGAICTGVAFLICGATLVRHFHLRR